MRPAVLLALASALHAQVAKEANSRYQTEEGRASMARGLGAEDRDRRQKPNELVAEMKIVPGTTVADVGTGVGYMAPFLSQAVGPAGKVLLQDIFDDFLAKARQRNRALANVEYIKGTESDPMLPENAVDQVLLLDVYHHFDYPQKMLAGIRRSLRPGGKLVVVEYYKNEKSMGQGFALKHIRLDRADVIREIEGQGFRLVREWVHTPEVQYGLILEKN